MAQGLLAACVLPWSEDDKLDTDAFIRHVGQAVSMGFENVYLMGTAGEGYGLTDALFETIVRLFVQVADGAAVGTQVGIISTSLQQVIERVEVCRAIGVKSFQISLPCWGCLADREIVEFFKRVCLPFPDCSFLHYNTRRAHRLLTGRDYRRVADEVPNLVATKNSTSDWGLVADIMLNAPDLQHFFVENAFACGTLYGECSLLNSYALLFPTLTRKWLDSARVKDERTVWELHKTMNGLEGILFGHVESTHIDGAFDKVITWLKDSTFPTRLLPPYAGLSESDKRRARAAFDASCSDLC